MRRAVLAALLLCSNAALADERVIGPSDKCDPAHPRAHSLTGTVTVEAALREAAARLCQRYLVTTSLLGRRVRVELPTDLDAREVSERLFEALDAAGVAPHFERVVRWADRAVEPEPPADATFRPPRAPAPELQAKLAKGIRRDGDRVVVDGKLLDELLADPTPLAMSARFVPTIQDGRPVGFKLFAIRSGSFYERIGLHNGDVVKAIDSLPLDTPDHALEAYAKVRKTDDHVIELERYGKPVRLAITVKR